MTLQPDWWAWVLAGGVVMVLCVLVMLSGRASR
jgi:hypothetical protein